MRNRTVSFLVRTRSSATFFAGFLIMSCVGCVGGGSREINLEPVRDTPKYTVMQDINGVRLEWKSKPGQRYIVMYRDQNAPLTDFRVLPGAGNVEGTGGVIRITDTSPSASRRRYRVERAMRPQGIPLK